MQLAEQIQNAMEKHHIDQRMRLNEQMGKAMGILRVAIIHLQVMRKHAETSTNQQGLNDVLKLMQESYDTLSN